VPLYLTSKVVCCKDYEPMCMTIYGFDYFSDNTVTGINMCSQMHK
jgi:hypothetical protein